MSDPKTDNTLAWVDAAAEAAADKKGRDTVILDVSKVLSITDSFIVTSGTNDRQVRAIAEAVEEKVREMGGPSPVHVEGRDEGVWVLVDYGTFVVHVFREDMRGFYDIERLWADVPREYWVDRAPAFATTN